MNNPIKVDWRDWNAESFSLARQQNKPVLLDIGAVWCHWCHVMDHGIPGDPVNTGTYCDPRVAEIINQNFIAIKVDNDKRPDINARYNMGGWPTTAFLTPDGDTLYGETYVPPDRMVGLLNHITKVFAEQKDIIAEQAQSMHVRRSRPQSRSEQIPPETAVVASIIDALKTAFDPVFGGFGNQPKFPHPAALALCLDEYSRCRDPLVLDILTKTLDGMCDGGMFDQFAGGFFRYSTTRDWSIPHYEKMLEDNGRLIPVYIRSAQLLQNEKYIRVVKQVEQWLISVMCDENTGTFAGSQDADQEDAYYGQPLEVRATMPTPFVDRTIYANWNLIAVSALVAHFKAEPQGHITERAERAYSYIWQHLTESVQSIGNVQMRRVSHLQANIENRPAGLLADQTAFITASLDLFEATGKSYYRKNAVAVANYVMHRFRDALEGGFWDIEAEDSAIGELKHAKKDMTENSEVAIAFSRLSLLVGDPAYKEEAVNALKNFSLDFGNQSYFASQYALAMRRVLRESPHVVIVGPKCSHTSALHEAVWSWPKDEVSVEWLNTDSAGLAEAAARNYKVSTISDAVAYVCVGTTCLPPVTTVDDLNRSLSTLPRP